MKTKFWIGASTLSVVLGMAAPAYAQKAPQPQSAKPAADDDKRGVDEIVVTAQKRAENVQDVPLSVAAVSAETLNSRQINNPTELVQVVPGLAFRESSNARGQGFALRGIGTAVFSDAVEQSVGAVVDGVPLARSGQATQDLIDVDHILSLIHI